jgi:diguanylate cyclase (GGDEF)-like protein
LKSLKNYLDDRAVEARRARRYIDRVIGYPISYIIREDFKALGSEGVPKGVGRVISPALRIITSVEEDIDGFVAVPYQRIAIDYVGDGIGFTCRNALKFTQESSEQLKEMVATLNSAPHIVENYKLATKDVAPYPPLITARLQRGAFYLFSFDPVYTMKLAQQLFEGVKLKGESGSIGLITYHRTDSYFISDEAVVDITLLISDLFGSEAALKQRRVFKNKSTAQEAHEAIRPTMLKAEYSPKALEGKMSEDLLRLYEYIWNITLCTQMKDSIYDSTQISVSIGGNSFGVQGNERLEEGWEALAGEFLKRGERDDGEDWKDDVIVLPKLYIAQELQPIDIRVVDGTPKRPARYGVGRFITKLDTENITRPSTIAGVLPSLVNKGYLEVKSGMIYPTFLGIAVDSWVSENAGWLNSLEDAKQFEDHIDAIERGDMENADEVIARYDALRHELEEHTGIVYIPNEEKPASEAYVNFAKKSLHEKGIEVDESELTTKSHVDKLLADSGVKREALHSCIACKSGKIYENAKAFSCNKCDFVVFKSGAIKRFKALGATLDETQIRELVVGALKKRYLVVIDMKGKKGPFSAKIKLLEDEKWGWQLSFAGFVDKENYDGAIVNSEVASKNTSTDNSVSSDGVVDTSLQSQMSNETPIVMGYVSPKADVIEPNPTQLSHIDEVDEQTHVAEPNEKQSPEQDELLQRIKELELQNENLAKEKRFVQEGARKDPLTRAYNRGAFDSEIIKFSQSNVSISVAFIDIDHFKRLNDDYGHQVGDEALVLLVNTLEEHRRKHDGLRIRFYRYGGEEFCIIFAETPKEDAVTFLESFRVKVEALQLQVANEVVKFTISIGYNFVNSAIALDPAAIIKGADELVYKAKDSGRNRLMVSS